MKTYTVTLNEEQYNLVAQCVEDCSRFLAGQCGMFHMLGCFGFDRREKAETALKYGVKLLLFPELKPDQSYAWNGFHCENEAQRKRIAMTYGIYRQMLHIQATHDLSPNKCNVYLSPTLKCDEQGPLPKIVVNEVKNTGKRTL